MVASALREPLIVTADPGPVIGAHLPGPDGLCVACEETYGRFAVAPCPWTRYAADDLEAPLAARIAEADRMARQHVPKGGMCSCSRPLPCSVVGVFDERRRDFEATLA